MSVGLFVGSLAVFLVYRLGNLIFMVFVSIFIAVAFEPPVHFLEKRGWKRGLATGLVFLISLLWHGLIFRLGTTPWLLGLFRIALIAGENEFTKDAVQLKNLAAKSARDVPIGELVQAVQTTLKNAT